MHSASITTFPAASSSPSQVNTGSTKVNHLLGAKKGSKAMP
jgi:hypothetical protein